MNEPLAERLRPKILEEFLSQTHLVGPKGTLTQHIKYPQGRAVEVFNGRKF